MVPFTYTGPIGLKEKRRHDDKTVPSHFFLVIIADCGEMEASYKDEKSNQGLPSVVTNVPEIGSTKRQAGIKRAVTLVGLCISVLVLSRAGCHRAGWTVKSALDRTKDLVFKSTPDTCPQVEQLLPKKNKDLWEDVGKDYFDESFKTKAIDWLAGAVRIP